MPTYRVTYRPGRASLEHELVDADEVRREGPHLVLWRDVLCVGQPHRVVGLRVLVSDVAAVRRMSSF